MSRPKKFNDFSYGVGLEYNASSYKQVKDQLKGNLDNLKDLADAYSKWIKVNPDTDLTQLLTGLKSIKGFIDQIKTSGNPFDEFIDKGVLERVADLEKKMQGLIDKSASVKDAMEDATSAIKAAGEQKYIGTSDKLFSNKSEEIKKTTEQIKQLNALLDELNNKSQKVTKKGKVTDYTALVLSGVDEDIEKASIKQVQQWFKDWDNAIAKFDELDFSNPKKVIETIKEIQEASAKLYQAADLTNIQKSKTLPEEIYDVNNFQNNIGETLLRSIKDAIKNISEQKGNLEKELESLNDIQKRFIEQNKKVGTKTGGDKLNHQVVVDALPSVDIEQWAKIINSKLADVSNKLIPVVLKPTFSNSSKNLQKDIDGNIAKITQTVKAELSVSDNLGEFNEKIQKITNAIKTAKEDIETHSKFKIKFAFESEDGQTVTNVKTFLQGQFKSIPATLYLKNGKSFTKSIIDIRKGIDEKLQNIGATLDKDGFTKGLKDVPINLRVNNKSQLFVEVENIRKAIETKLDNIGINLKIANIPQFLAQAVTATTLVNKIANNQPPEEAKTTTKTITPLDVKPEKESEKQSQKAAAGLDKISDSAKKAQQNINKLNKELKDLSTGSLRDIVNTKTFINTGILAPSGRKKPGSSDYLSSKVEEYNQLCEKLKAIKEGISSIEDIYGKGSNADSLYNEDLKNAKALYNELSQVVLMQRAYKASKLDTLTSKQSSDVSSKAVKTIEVKAEESKKKVEDLNASLKQTQDALESLRKEGKNSKWFGTFDKDGNFSQESSENVSKLVGQYNEASEAKINVNKIIQDQIALLEQRIAKHKEELAIIEKVEKAKTSTKVNINTKELESAIQLLKEANIEYGLYLGKKGEMSPFTSKDSSSISGADVLKNEFASLDNELYAMIHNHPNKFSTAFSPVDVLASINSNYGGLNLFGIINDNMMKFINFDGVDKRIADEILKQYQSAADRIIQEADQIPSLTDNQWSKIVNDQLNEELNSILKNFNLDIVKTFDAGDTAGIKAYLESVASAAKTAIDPLEKFANIIESAMGKSVNMENPYVNQMFTMLKDKSLTYQDAFEELSKMRPFELRDSELLKSMGFDYGISNLPPAFVQINKASQDASKNIEDLTTRLQNAQMMLKSLQEEGTKSKFFGTFDSDGNKVTKDMSDLVEKADQQKTIADQLNQIYQDQIGYLKKQEESLQNEIKLLTEAKNISNEKSESNAGENKNKEIQNKNKQQKTNTITNVSTQLEKEKTIIDAINTALNKDHVNALKAAIEAEEAKRNKSKELTEQLKLELEALKDIGKLTANKKASVSSKKDKDTTAASSAIAGNYKTIEKAVLDYIPDSNVEKAVVDMKPLADGVVEVRGVLKDANNEWKTYTAQVDASGKVDKYKIGLNNSLIQSYLKMQKVLQSISEAENVEEKSASEYKAERQIAVIDKLIERIDAYNNKAFDGNMSGDFDNLMAVQQQLRDMLNLPKEEREANFDALLDNMVQRASNAAQKIQKALRDSLAGDNLIDSGHLNDYFKDFYIQDTDVSSIFNQMSQKVQEYAQSIGNVDAKVLGFNATNKTLTFSLTDASGTVRQFTMRLKDLTGAVEVQDKSIEKVDGQWKQFASSLGKAGKQFVTAFIGGTGIYKLASEIREGIQAVKQLDLALTELRKVTDETEETYDKFLVTASKTASVIGSTLTDFTNATADFARLGYNISESTDLAKAAIVYKNVGDEIDDISTATESIISTMKAFGIEAEDAMGIVDRFNEVGAYVAQIM